MRIGQLVIIRILSMNVRGYFEAIGTVSAIHEDGSINAIRADGQPLANGQQRAAVGSCVGYLPVHP